MVLLQVWGGWATSGPLRTRLFFTLVFAAARGKSCLQLPDQRLPGIQHVALRTSAPYGDRQLFLAPCDVNDGLGQRSSRFKHTP